jgi:hypothetical protein
VIDYIRSGQLGKIQYIVCFANKARTPIGKRSEPLPIPETLDYDLWCGPARKEPIYRDRIQYDCSFTWDKGDGTDVDLHVYDSVGRKEAWFGNLSIPKGSLDMDNTEGYGPETYTGSPTTYGVSVNYWYGTGTVNYKVRVITKTTDSTYTGSLSRIGQWKDIGKFEIPAN